MSEVSPRIPRSGVAGGQWASTVGTWLVLVLLFGGIYGLASHRYGGAVSGVMLGASLVVMVAMFARFVGEAGRFRAAQADAQRRIALGELATARDAMWTWAEQARSSRISAIARYWLGYAMLRRGELDEAAAVMIDAEAEHMRELALSGLAVFSPALLALTHALRGDSAQAEQDLARIEKLVAGGGGTAAGGAVALARAVWLCRTGGPETAAVLLDERWAEIEATTTGDVVRPLRIVRAFAHAAAGPRAPAFETPRPAYPGEYAFLGTKWPEMAAFLAAHELS